jgi:sugar phosphate isomerase/epimerase
LESEIARAGRRIIGFHVCDWMTPTADFLNDRGLMGEGCIDIPGIRGLVEKAGFDGPIEVEIFSTRHWARDQDQFLADIITAYKTKV